MRARIIATIFGSFLTLIGKQQASAEIYSTKEFRVKSVVRNKPELPLIQKSIVPAAHKLGHKALPLPSLTLVPRGKIETLDTAHFVYVLFGKRGAPETSATAKRALELACSWNGLGKLSNTKIKPRKRKSATNDSLDVKPTRRGAIILPVTASKKEIENGSDLWNRYDTEIASKILNSLNLDPEELWLVYSEMPLVDFVTSNPGKAVNFSVHADLISGVSEAFLSSRFEATMALIDDEKPFEYRRLEKYLAMIEDGLSVFDGIALAPPSMSIGGPAEPEVVCQVN